jgi:hypothetical protein
MTRALALLMVIGCTNGPSNDQCKQLLDHLVDLEFKKAGAQASSDALKAELAKNKATVSDKVSAEFLDTCTKKLSRSRVECALAANDLDGENGVARCDDAK